MNYLYNKLLELKNCKYEFQNEKLPLIQYKHFKFIYKQFFKFKDYSNLNSLKQIMFFDLNEYEAFKHEFRLLKFKQLIIGGIYFFSFLLLFNKLYNFSLLYSLKHKRLMLKFKPFALGLASFSISNFLLNTSLVNLNDVVALATNTKFSLYLWFELNYLNVSLTEHNFNYLDDFILNKYEHLKIKEVQILDFKRLDLIIFYFLLKEKYFSMFLANKVKARVLFKENNLEALIKKDKFKDNLKAVLVKEEQLEEEEESLNYYNEKKDFFENLKKFLKFEYKKLYYNNEKLKNTNEKLIIIDEFNYLKYFTEEEFKILKGMFITNNEFLNKLII